MKNVICLYLILLVVSGHANNHPKRIVHQETSAATLEKAPFLTSSIKEDQLYLNIPDQLLDSPMLFTCYDRMRRSFMQVAWTKHNDRILLKQLAILSTSGITIPLKEGLVQMDNVLAIFPIEKTNIRSGIQRINITKFTLNQELEWPQMWGVSLGNPVPQLSVLLDAKNIDGEVLIKIRRGMIKSKTKVSVPIFFGFSALPPPMKSRRYDYRMGFHPDDNEMSRFGLKNTVANITRWRLEKKYPNKKISIPIKPITFLISPDVPKKWRSYLKAGIKEWLPAFEAAGFKDALVVMELDSLDEWQAHSIHSNVVHWNQEKSFRSSEHKDFGGTISHIIDLRTGEILRGDIFMGGSEDSVSEEYFVRAAPLDKKAQKFPFPDALIGQLFQVIAAHEAGHVFGITDANFGEYHYPWDKMNDIPWLQTMGHTPSIMNYTRTNNIPQPEDSIPPSLLLPRVGPTDKYNIQWAYTEFPDGTEPRVEEAALEQMIRWQDSIPWYRFNFGQIEVIGPNASNEVVETNDPIKSTKLALKNVERVITLLPKVTIDQKDNDLLERLYNKSVHLWYNHMLHVSTLIGGYDIHYKSLAQSGSRYIPIPWEDQMEALDFLLNYAFDPPVWLTEPDFHVRTNYTTFFDQTSLYQQKLLIELLLARRLKRMEYLEQIENHKGLVNTYIQRLQDGLFKELRKDFDHVNRRKQEIQMSYIDNIVMILEQKNSALDIQSRFFVHSDYSKGILTQQLLDLKVDIEKSIKRNSKAETLGHWQLCLKKIKTIL